jgi:ArsR family transcriptional regulator
MNTTTDDTVAEKLESPEHSACTAPAAVLRLNDDQAECIVVLAKALSHPVRVHIVDILSRQAKELCVCEVEQLFSLTQPTISHHLKVLRQAGIVNVEQRGLWAFYSLKTHAFDALTALLEPPDMD